MRTPRTKFWKRRGWWWWKKRRRWKPAWASNPTGHCAEERRPQLRQAEEASAEAAEASAEALTKAAEAAEKAQNTVEVEEGPPSLYNNDVYSTWQDRGFLEAPGNAQPWPLAYNIYIYIYIHTYIHTHTHHILTMAHNGCVLKIGYTHNRPIE